MSTPTERLTRNAQDFIGLGNDVVLALRVEWGLGTDKPTFWSALGTWLFVRNPLAIPLVTYQRARAAIRTMGDDTAAGCGILAFTADDGRILLSAMPVHRKTPTGVIEVLPDAAPLAVDVEWMETYLVPRLTVGEHDLVVNSVDFKALIKSVENGTVTAPNIARHLDRLKSIGQRQFG